MLNSKQNCNRMKRMVFFFFFIPLYLQAQQVQYASKVLKFSSDLGGKLNSVKRITGKPDAFPQGGSSANAWVSKDALGSAFVEVEFEKAQSVKQIAVFENLNGGCVTRIQIGTASGKLNTVKQKSGGFVRWVNSWQTSGNADRAYYFNKKRRKIEVAQNVEHNADIDYVFLENIQHDVKVVRVEFNFGLKPGQKQIDAIAISDSDSPILPVIDLLNGAEHFQDPERLVYTPDRDHDLNSIFISDNTMYYTVSVYGKISEIHALDLTNPTNSVDVSRKIRNDKQLNYILGFSPLTKMMLMGSERKFRRDDQAIGFDFFHYNEGIFSYQKPLKVTAYNNYGDYADAFLTNDGKRILFGVESDMTNGGFDIYFAEPKDDETFGLLQNIGKGVNTAADETNPFLLSDNKTLIFASNGYSGYGDFDLYVTTRLDDTWKNWSEPKNLGPKVNGSSFDVNPYYDEKAEMLYYVSLREGVSCIYKIKVPRAQLTTTK